VTPWTDDELGYLVDNMSVRAPVLAGHLDRTTYSINCMKRLIRNGYAGPQQSRWSNTEDSLLAESEHLTSAQLSKALPGRTPGAIVARRIKVAAPAHYGRKSPYEPGRRNVLAKTCRKCGLLLDGSWFIIKTKSGVGSTCRKCASRASVRRAKSGSIRSPYAERAQAITLPSAENVGQEYTEADHEKLADPTITALGKALILKRSYYAVRGALRANGYKSREPLGDPTLEQWRIDNPNASRIDEITAALKQEFESAGVKFHEWDWDDEDLKETP
jgi:hypothetical protein